MSLRGICSGATGYTAKSTTFWTKLPLAMFELLRVSVRSKRPQLSHSLKRLYEIQNAIFGYLLSN